MSLTLASLSAGQRIARIHVQREQQEHRAPRQV